MAKPKVALVDQQLDDLSPFLAADDKILSALIREVSGLSTGELVKPSTLRKIFSSHLGKDAANRILRLTLFWSTFARQNKIEISDIANSVSVALEKDSAPDRLKAWQDRSEIFCRLITQPQIYYASKALDLSYDFTNFCLSSRIISDMRPIFTEERSEILGIVMAHSLRIDFVNSEGQHTITIAMELDDIRRLSAACSDVEKKEKAIELLVVQKVGLKAFALGEETYSE